jgi:hypothetical protein
MALIQGTGLRRSRPDATIPGAAVGDCGPTSAPVLMRFQLPAWRWGGLGT